MRQQSLVKTLAAPSVTVNSLGCEDEFQDVIGLQIFAPLERGRAALKTKFFV
jgi:hypothetical protein